MNTDFKNELPLKSYLLGDLNTQEQQRLEQRLMIDSAAFEELCWIEDELIDDYMDGALSDREKEKFENIFLSAPERHQKLRLAKALKRYTAANRQKKTHWYIWLNAGQAFWRHQSRTLKWILAASLLLLIGGSSWSTLQISRLQVALDQEQTEASKSQRQLKEIQSQNLKLAASLEHEQARRTQLEQEAANLKRAQMPGPSLIPGQIQTTLLTAILAPGRSRGSDGMQEINIPSGESVVKLDLKMEPLDYPGYNATLERIGKDKNRTVIAQQTESRLQGQFSGLFVPAELMTRGDYVLRLSGITVTGKNEDIGSYYFRILPQ